MAICLIRGTSGSGKSTVAFTFLKKFPHKKITDNKGKVIAYEIDAGLKSPVYLVGRYETPTGGLDGVPTQQLAADMCLYFSNEKGGHVLAEGLLQSAAGPAGALTKAVYENGNARFLVLDTPLELCIERVKQRRANRGDDRPFNSTNTELKWKQTMDTAKALSKLGYDVRPVDHTRAFEDVYAVFKEADDE